VLISYYLVSKSGLLKEDFSKLGETLILNFKKPSLHARIRRKLLKSSVILDEVVESDYRYLTGINFNLIYANTIHNDKIANSLQKFIKAPMIVHVHEQPYIMNLHNTPELRYHMECTSKFITVSNTSGVGLNTIFNISFDKITNVHPAVSYPQIEITTDAINLVREELCLPKDAFIVLGMGTPHWIKGVDLFVQVAMRAIKINPLLHFIWVGGDETNEYLNNQKRDVDLIKLSKNIHFVSTTKDPDAYFKVSDLFFLSSRVDTLPLVILEASQFSLPVICFKNSGGVTEIVDDNCGSIIEYYNIDQTSEEIVFYSKNKEIGRRKGNCLKMKVTNSYAYESMCIKLGNFVDTQIQQK
jgi:glycosyltransferase involved in cell wall biosynthesis